MKTAVKVICVLGSGLALCLWTGYACMIGYRIGEQDTKKHYTELDKQLEKFR